MCVYHCVLDNQYTPGSLIVRRPVCEKVSILEGEHEKVST